MRKELLSIALILYLSAEVVAQDENEVRVKISGEIIDSLSGSRVPDVHVSTSFRGTISDPEGKFCISVSEGETLQFTHVNYYPVTVDLKRVTDIDFLQIKMTERVKVLPEIHVRDAMSEEELKNKVLAGCPPVSSAQKAVSENSRAINQLGKIAPPPVPTLSEQYFESLQGPKDVTILSTSPSRGIGKMIRSLRHPERPGQFSRPSDYRSDPGKVTPFRIKLDTIETMKSDTTVVVKEQER
jgi:hypothetical protein